MTFLMRDYLRLADRIGLVAVLGTAPLFALAPYAGAGAASIIAAVWYAMGIGAMAFFVIRAMRLRPSEMGNEAPVPPAGVAHRALAIVVLVFLAAGVSLVIMPGRSRHILRARLTAQEARRSRALRRIVLACEAYAEFANPSKLFPPSLAVLERWLRCPSSATALRSLSPGQTPAGTERAVRDFRRGVGDVYCGSGVPSSGPAYMVLLSRLDVPGGWRVLMAMSDASIKVLRAGQLATALRAEAQRRALFHVPGCGALLRQVLRGGKWGRN